MQSLQRFARRELPRLLPKLSPPKHTSRNVLRLPGATRTSRNQAGSLRGPRPGMRHHQQRRHAKSVARLPGVTAANPNRAATRRARKRAVARLPPIKLNGIRHLGVTRENRSLLVFRRALQVVLATGSSPAVHQGQVKAPRLVARMDKVQPRLRRSTPTRRSIAKPSPGRREMLSGQLLPVNKLRRTQDQA